MLFSALFVQPELADAVSERAWIIAMLDAESALAWAEARVGVIPASAMDKIALDITLLSQTEVREVTERGGEMHGGSSTMPQKRNALGSVLTRSCVRQARGNMEVLMRSMEHERVAGAWHAETSRSDS